MFVEFLYLFACLSITLLAVLVAVLVQVSRRGADAFESWWMLSFANRAKDIVAPFLIAGFTLWLVFFYGLGNGRIWVVAVIGAGWLLLMWSRVGFVLVLFQVCVLARLFHGPRDIGAGRRRSAGWTFRPATHARRDT